jgi:hypothetical protein
MYAPMRYNLPMTLIRRRRIMPVSGKVLARAGQKVGATDTIAESNLYPEYLLLDIARGLGMPPSKTDSYLQCQAGDQLAEKDIIAGPIGLSHRIVRSPRAGKVVVAADGQVLLEIVGQPFQMKAGLPGEVVELVAERGAVIESAGALVQGVWGNGRIDAGQLSVLATSPDHEIKPSELDVSSRGWIVLAGHCSNPDVLKIIEELPLRGLILGSLEARLVPAATKSPVPILVLEGFGQRPIGAVTHKLLASLERRDVALNAEAGNAFSGTKPEVFFPAVVPGAVTPAPDFVPLEVNRQARLVRPPHTGETCTVVEIKGMTAFPGGLRARAALVRLENGDNAIIPLANLEVLV